MAKAENTHILNKRVRLTQPENGFRAGLDSVMLAAACPAQPGDHVLDLGCGVGSAGLCVLARVQNTNLTGIEIQDDHVQWAVENARDNGMDERARFITEDIRNYKDARFDHVICNPPYLESGAHIPSPTASKATARGHEGRDTDLKAWIDCAVRNLKSGGSLSIIHRADQTDRILQNMEKRFGGCEIVPLWPKAGVPAKRVIIRAFRDRKSPATLHPGLILHEHDGAYTAAAEEVLRNGQPLL